MDTLDIINEVFGGREKELKRFLAVCGRYLEAHVKLTKSLNEVSKDYSKGDDDNWRPELLVCLRVFLHDIKIHGRLVEPLDKLIADERNEIELRERRTKGERGNPRLGTETAAMICAAAAVTALKQGEDRLTIDKALDAVARASGLDRKRLENFRNNLHRGLLPESCLEIYKNQIARQRKMLQDGSVSEFLQHYPNLGGLVRRRT